jgi:hydroxymethylpyrimidine pyrophosphatase-like HAD family hydrolase
MIGGKMEIRKSELVVCIDVDETLIMNETGSGTGPRVAFDYYGKTVFRHPNIEHIELLKSYKKRGYEVVVWSANGWYWANDVIEGLKLKEYVDVVATKPIKYVDDKDANNWMQRVYISE